MTIFFNRFLGQFNRLIDWFVPAEVNDDRELTKQVRMFLISHILGPFIGNSVPIALYLFDPNPGVDVAILAVAISGFWAFPFVLRAYGHYYFLAVLSIQNLIFCILWSCYFYGGITSPTLPWVLTIPLLAFFYIGSAPALRLVVLGMFTVNFAIFYLLSALKGLPTHAIPFASLQGLGLVSTAAASMYVGMMAFFYAKVLASQTELESEMREHFATANKLRQATEEAERAGAAKADFLAKMSHELRTPLNAVIGYSQILLEDVEETGDLETIGDLQRIHSAGRHLLKLVNEVLDLIKIDAGKMELYREPLEISALLNDVTRELAQSAQAGNVTVRTKYLGDLSGLIIDKFRLRDAVSELIDNAIKFSPNGTVDIVARREPAVFGPDSDALVIDIRDTGVGIREEHLPAIFEQFNVLNDASSSKYGGTGLGLALTKRICHLLGGDIQVESTSNVGSCFTVRIPFKAEVQDKDERDEISTSAEDDAGQALLTEEAIKQLKTTLGGHTGEIEQDVKVAANG